MVAKILSVVLGGLAGLFLIMSQVVSESNKNILIAVFITQSVLVFLDSNQFKKAQEVFIKSISIYFYLYVLVLNQNKESLFLLICGGTLFLNIYYEIKSPPWGGRILKNSALTATFFAFLLMLMSVYPFLPPELSVKLELLGFAVLALQESFLIKRYWNQFATYVRVLVYAFGYTLYLKNYLSTANFIEGLKNQFEIVTVFLLLIPLVLFIFQKNEEKRKAVFSSIWTLLIFSMGLSLNAQNYGYLLFLGIFASWTWATISQEKINTSQLIFYYAAPGTLMFTPLLGALSSVDANIAGKAMWVWPIALAIVWGVTAMNEKERVLDIHGRKQWFLILASLLIIVLLFNNTSYWELL